MLALFTCIDRNSDRRSAWRNVFLLLALVFAGSSSLCGQAASGTGSISGLVTDPTGAIMPGAMIEVRNLGTNVARTLVSNDAGLYEAVALQPGTYEVKASKSGFATLVRAGITVAVGQAALVNMAMQVSVTSETVTVSGDTTPVDTTKTDVSSLVNLKDMMNLPMSGRRWDSFALSTPGTTNDSGFGLLSFRGMSGLYNNNMIDGMDNNQAFFSEAKGRTRLSFAYSIDAIQEFQVGNSAFSAQYGRAAGGVVNAVTRSGGNDIHGTGFYLIRDDSLNAANPFSANQLVAVGLPGKPKDRRQQFGGSVGGPIKRDKLFYFGNYEQQKRNFPMSVVPSSSTFFNSTCTAPGCPQVVPFFQSLIETQPRQGNESVGLGKIDYNVNPNNGLTGSVNILRWDSPNGIQTAPSTAVHHTMNGSDDVSSETVIGKWTSNFTPTFLSELRFQYGRDFEFELPNAPGPSVSTTNGINFGMPNFLPRAAYPDEKRIQFSQNLNWLHGKHSVKFGWDVTRVDDLQINLFQGGGVYSYSSLNNFALDCGNASSVPLANCQAATTGGGVTGAHYTTFSQAFDSLGAAGSTDFQTWDAAGYVEDTFRPMTNLTVNLGLRYEIQTMPALKGNPLDARTSNINLDTNNFGPRLGISWDPGKDQKTVIRMGGGIYYGRTQNSTIANLITNNGIRFVSYTLTPTSAGAPIFPNVLSAPPSGAGSRPDIVFADPNFANPITYQGEFSIEREVLHNTTLSAIYMVNRGQRMPVYLDSNLPAPVTNTYTVCGTVLNGTASSCANPAGTITVPFFTGARPNPNFGFMTDVASVVNTWYNGLVIQAKHRFSHGFQFDAGFTWSKAQDDLQNSQTFTTSESALNPLNLKGDYSLSDFDQRKRFTLSGVWELPTHNIQNKSLKRVVDGFQISSIVTLADGRPYSGLISGSPGSPSPVGTTSGVLGDGGLARFPGVGRNTFTNPGANSVDVRLSRAINLTERIHWLLMAEAFNVANRYEITSVNTTQYQFSGTTLFPQASFGTRSASGTNLFGARQIQLGTRITF
ncbi:MAG TPA: carboxypeptidase regulatory-like domain-containing protein [Bryobacteraceae bacterium]|nr:carboxypeptidase regulatory-like domain-containing protein [Bryobacteraceae bacterium]